jgi:serine/threonine protein kinase
MFQIYTIDSLKNKNFEPNENEKIAEGSYGKIYLHKSKIYKCMRVKYDDEILSALDEITIHQACYHVYSKHSRHDNSFAKIPKIYEVYRKNVNSNQESYIIITIVMENVGETFYNVMDKKIKKNGLTKSTLRQVCTIVCQICNLIKLLQKKLKFSHRDLHTSNIMLLPSKYKNTCGDHLYNVYMIDFGFSRIQVGKKIVHGNTFFKKPIFNQRFDMTLLMFDIFYYTFRCFIRKQKNISCKHTLPKKVLYLWLSILMSTGVNFSKFIDDNDNFDRAGLYNAFMKFHKISNEYTSIPYIEKHMKLLIHELCS